MDWRYPHRDKEHGFLMTNADELPDSNSSIFYKSKKHEQSDELTEGKHFLGRWNFQRPMLNQSLQRKHTDLLDERGIVRLASLSRAACEDVQDWAEDLVVNLMEHGQRWRA
jgi:hypothetical protein